MVGASVNSPAIVAFGPGTAPPPKTAKEAAEAFESVFLAQMLSQMFSGLTSEGPFSGGFSEQVYRSMLTDQYAATLSKQGGIGLADAVTRQLLKLQEVA